MTVIQPMLDMCSYFYVLHITRIFYVLNNIKVGVFLNIASLSVFTNHQTHPKTLLLYLNLPCYLLL